MTALLPEVGMEVRPRKTAMGDAGPCGAGQQQDIVAASGTPHQPPATAGAGHKGLAAAFQALLIPQGTRSPRGRLCPPHPLHRATHPGLAETFGCTAAAPAKPVSAPSQQLFSVPAPLPKGRGASSGPR